MLYFVKHDAQKIKFDKFTENFPFRHTHHTWYRENTGNGQWFGGSAEITNFSRYDDLLGWEVSKEEYHEWMEYAISHTEEMEDSQQRKDWDKIATKSNFDPPK